METKNTPDLATGPCDLCGTADSARWWAADAKGKPPTLFGHAKLCDACHGRGRGALERLMAGALQLSIEAVEGMAGRLEVGLKGGIDGMIAARRAKLAREAAARPPGVPSSTWAPPVLDPQRVVVDPSVTDEQLDKLADINAKIRAQAEADDAHRDMWASTFEERPRPIPVPRHEPAVVAAAAADQRAAVEAEVRGHAADVIAALRGTYEARLDRLEKNVAEFAGWIIKQGADKALDGTPGLLKLLAGRIAEVEGELRDWGAGVNQRLLELEAAAGRKVNVQIHGIRINDPDPDRFVHGMVAQFEAAKPAPAPKHDGEELGGSRAKIRHLEGALDDYRRSLEVTEGQLHVAADARDALERQLATRDRELENAVATARGRLSRCEDLEHERDGYRAQLATSEEETAIAERRIALLEAQVAELGEINVRMVDRLTAAKLSTSRAFVKGDTVETREGRVMRVNLVAAHAAYLEALDGTYQREPVPLDSLKAPTRKLCTCDGVGGSMPRPCSANRTSMGSRWYCGRTGLPGLAGDGTEAEIACGVQLEMLANKYHLYRQETPEGLEPDDSLRARLRSKLAAL